MRTSNSVYFLFLALSFQFVHAQDSIINRNVTVEREYKPVIQDAGKINSLPEILEPKTEKSTAIYSNFNLPLTVDFNIHTLASAELKAEVRTPDKGGFARLGLGNYFNTLADFAYPLLKKPDILLDVSINHLATFGEKAHSTTTAALAFDKRFKKINFYAGVGGGHEYFRYYGNNFNRLSTLNLDTLLKKSGPLSYTETSRAGNDQTLRVFQLADLANDSISNTLWRFNAFSSFKTHTPINDWQYHAGLKYNSLRSGYGISEQQLSTVAGIEKLLSDNKAGVDMELNNLIYNAKRPNLLNFADSYSVLTLNPYYAIERKNWDVRLGVKTSVNFEPQRFGLFPSADLKAEWKVLPANFSVYGGVTGGLKLNSLNEIYTENPYIFPEIRVRDTYTPISMYAGLKLKPVQNVFLDAYINYSHINNQYFFVNKEYGFPDNPLTLPEDFLIYTNRFHVIYSDAALTKIGIRAGYHLQNIVNIELKGAYNDWNVQTEIFAWNRPKWEANFSAQVHVNKKLSITTLTFFESVRYAKLGASGIRMRPKVDINIAATYLHNKWLSSFVKLNNLINNPYQHLYGYQLQGINFLAGASVAF